MGYVFRARERIDSGLRRVVREQVRGAIHDLRDPREDRHEGVHEARKRFKMIRATLRLARPTLGELVFRLENAWYRDTGKRLSSVRDAVAMIESLEGLRKRFAKEMPPEMGDAVRRGLDGRLRGVSEDGRALARRCREVA